MATQDVTCFYCNGFYGPTYGEPICAVCHTFLYPGFLSSHPDLVQTQYEADDEDSGNDEPIDPYYGVDLREQQINIHVSQAASLAQRLERLAVFCADRESYSSQSPTLIDCLPPEVLLTVFSYLDELSLWCVGNVCTRWQGLLHSYISQDRWQYFTLRMWPLFKPLYKITDWFQAYSSLMNNSNCLMCIQQMALQKLPPLEEENSWRRNRIRSELKTMRTDPPEGISACPLDLMCCHWQAMIRGPVGSPYEGGLFYLYVQVPYTYPMSPPIVRFLTKIFHPNISRHGDIGLDSISHNWSLALTISKVLISVQSLLTDPFCDVSMEPVIAKLCRENTAAYEEQARLWTWKYAMNEVMKPLMDISIDNMIRLF